MLKTRYLLIVIVFLLAGCFHSGKKQSLMVVENAPSIVTQQFRKTPNFTQIDVIGRINANLHTGYRRPQVILKGDARDLAQIKTVVTQSTLYLVVGEGYPRYGAIHADIQGRFLNSVRYKGTGYLVGTQLHSSFLELYLANQGTTKLGGSLGLHTLNVEGSGLTQISGISSPYLEVNLKGTPKVQLTGLVKLSKLHINGSGWLSLYWVKSDNLLIRAKEGAKIQLAGIVNRLDVELWGAAQFKGRYLRAQRSFVKTHDKSNAEISAVSHQSSLATDASDIYYYNLPHTRADFMAFSGSVLDMRDWSQADQRDFNIYNKQFP